MKAKYMLVLVVSVILLSASSFGQYSCPPDATTQQPLVCLLPFSNTNLAPQGKGAPTVGNTSTNSLPLNASIAAQLTQLPIPSGASGTITLQEAGNPAGHPFDDLGPVLTDRPETLGRGHLYSGFTYQHFNFNAIDGINLKNVSFGFSTNQGSTTYYVGDSTSIRFKLDQYVALITYGVSKTTDISVVVPINTVSVSASASDIKDFSYDSVTSEYAPVSATGSTPTISGSAHGVGDVKFGIKQLIYGSEGSSFAIASGLGFRIPSGDPYNFLGSGAYGVDIYGLVSYRSYKSPFSPHFKIGKQWNGPTPLLNPTGAGDLRLPGGMQYDAGVDVRIYKRKLTLGVDVIGSQFVNGQVLQPGSIALTPEPSTANSGISNNVPKTLAASQPVNDSYTVINLSSGIKYAPTSKLLIYGNVLVQLNNVGLRSDPVPLVGVSYNFHLGKSD